MKSARCFVLVSILALLCASVVKAQEKAERLGKVHFPVSCSAAAQTQFNRAVALLHSFWFSESDKAFAAVAQTDSSCAMAFWGIAMGARLNPISNVPNAAALKRGLEAVENAKSSGANSERERDYIAAVEAFYKDGDKLDHTTRSLAYERTMERIYLRYPEDQEAAIFYALSLLPNETLLSTDKSYEKQLKAGAILEKIFAEKLDHPGVAHYIIHAYDYPALASRALVAARRYDKIAPSSDHALHMPSHIYTRLGLWPESIQSNLAAAAAAKENALKINPGAPAPIPLHMLSFLMEAYLQGSQDREAKGVLDELNSVQKVSDTLGAAVVVAGIPARYMMEKKAWAEAASLQPRPSRYHYAEAITYFARAIGSARSGDIAGARKNVEKLQALRDAAAQAKQDYWAQQIEIQRLAAAGWLARLEGKNEEALNLMRAAADLENSTQEHQTARDAIIPARQLLGELLIELGKPGEALKEFEASINKEPNRFHGLYGAANASELSGDGKKAKTYYAMLVALCERGDTDRAELKQAKAFLAKK